MMCAKISRTMRRDGDWRTGVWKKELGAETGEEENGVWWMVMVGHKRREG